MTTGSFFEPSHLTAVGNTLYFVAGTPATGMQLCRSDGTESGTRVVSNIQNSTSSGVDIENLTVSGGRVFFSATDATVGRALWVTDGTTAGTVCVSDLTTGAGLPENLFDAGNGTLYFSALEPATSRRTLWKTLGTTATTARVANVLVNPDVPFARLGTLVYFASAEPSRFLYKTDGTAAGTTAVTGANNTTLVAPRELTTFGSFLYASSATALNSARFELYRTDGTTFGTSLVASTLLSPTGSEPFGLTVANGKLFFAAWPDFPRTRPNLYVTTGNPPMPPAAPIQPSFSRS